jgi:uncharacterized protein YkwD
MSERSGTFMRRCAAVLVALTAVGALSAFDPIPRHAPTPAPRSSTKSAPPTATERQVINAINHFRAAHGLRALTVNGNVSDKAKLWAAWMAGGNCGRGGNGIPKICHSNLTSGINPGWSLLEENVGAAAPKTNVAGLVSGFEHSPAHAANMLNQQINYVGVGVAYTGNTIFVAEEFMAR